MSYHVLSMFNQTGGFPKECGTETVQFGRMHPFRRPMVVTKAMHGQAVSTTISSYFMEFRVALARDVCRFAPVITRMAGNTAELFKIGSWGDWQYRQRC